MGTEESKELRLLNKKRNGFGSVLFSWTGVVLLLMVVTVLLYIVVLLRYIKWVPVFGFLAVITHLAVILRLISSSMDSTAKVTWMLMIILFPFFSVFLYIYIHLELGTHMLRRNFRKLRNRNHEILHYDREALQDRKSTRLNSSHPTTSRMPSSA